MCHCTLKIISNALYIQFLWHVRSQYTVIWSDVMETNNGWLLGGNTNEIIFGYDSGGCFTNTCCKTDAGNYQHAWIYKSTDISGYASVQLQYDVSSVETEEGDVCNVYYAYDTQSAKTLIKTHDPPSEDRMFWPAEVITFADASSATTLWIWLEAYSGSFSSGGTDVCYWDNVFLRGEKGAVNPTTNPTKNPTPDPTSKPTQNPTIKPTLNPTQSPTPSPTKKPIVISTSLPTTAIPTTLSSASTAPTIQTASEPTTPPTSEPNQSISPTARTTPSPTSKPTEPPVTSSTEEQEKDSNKEYDDNGGNIWDTNVIAMLLLFTGLSFCFIGFVVWIGCKIYQKNKGNIGPSIVAHDSNRNPKIKASFSNPSSLKKQPGAQGNVGEDSIGIQDLPDLPFPFELEQEGHRKPKVAEEEVSDEDEGPHGDSLYEKTGSITLGNATTATSGETITRDTGGGDTKTIGSFTSDTNGKHFETETIGAFTAGDTMNDAHAVQFKAQCADCLQVKDCSVYEGNGQFYCNDCWLYYSYT